MPTVATGGTNATATATPGNELDTSVRTVAYAPAAPAARATRRSAKPGLVRANSSTVKPLLGTHRASSHARTIAPIVAPMTVAADRRPSLNQPIAKQADKPSTGVISGATSMAPMTTAAELAIRPITAITTERPSMITKRLSQWSRCRTARASSTRRRSGPDCRLLAHRRGRVSRPSTSDVVGVASIASQTTFRGELALEDVEVAVDECAPA